MKDNWVTIPMKRLVGYREISEGTCAFAVVLSTVYEFQCRSTKCFNFKSVALPLENLSAGDKQQYKEQATIRISVQRVILKNYLEKHTLCNSGVDVRL